MTILSRKSLEHVPLLAIHKIPSNRSILQGRMGREVFRRWFFKSWKNQENVSESTRAHIISISVSGSRRRIVEQSKISPLLRRGGFGRNDKVVYILSCRQNPEYSGWRDILPWLYRQVMDSFLRIDSSPMSNRLSPMDEDSRTMRNACSLLFSTSVISGVNMRWSRWACEGDSMRPTS